MDSITLTLQTFGVDECFILELRNDALFAVNKRKNCTFEKSHIYSRVSNYFAINYCQSSSYTSVAESINLHYVGN